MTRALLLLLATVCLPACRMQPLHRPLPFQPALEVETRDGQTQRLEQVELLGRRGDDAEPLNRLPRLDRTRRGIPWEDVRRIDVPPPDDWLTEPSPHAVLRVQTAHGTEDLSVDTGPGRRALVLRGRGAQGLTTSLDLLDCAQVRVLRTAAGGGD